jgi:hypothetical protein
MLTRLADGAALDLHEGICDPAADGCGRWPEHLRLVDHATGELVRGRCRATNLCSYCPRLYVVETVEMLTLDALEYAPTLWLVLTAREHLTRAGTYSHLRQLRNAARRQWPAVEWFVQVEFQRRGALHLNLLVKGVGAYDRRRHQAAALRCQPMDEDLRVESLTYSVVPVGGTSFSEEAEPVTLEAEGFTATLERGTLNATMKNDYSTEAEAREVVEPHLQAWEAVASLRQGRPLFSFRYGGSRTINRAAPPGNHDVRDSGVAHLTGSLTVHVGRGSYPDPPEEPFALNPEVEILMARWRLFAEERDTLLGMAYFCLTFIEFAYGGGNRTSAARTLGVATNVLNTLGRLTAAGDSATARKVSAQNRPLAPEEEAWIVRAIAALILRAGLLEAEPERATATHLTMVDLPRLPEP